MERSTCPAGPTMTLVIPSYNEAQRLPMSSFRAYLAHNSNVRLLFVNDGSTDDTLSLLHVLRNEFPHLVDVFDQPRNLGKAAAVRAGMLRAITLHASLYTGFWDADLATPLAEVPRLFQLLLQMPQVEILLGSRVQLLGRAVHRRVWRHYSGRIFASLASLSLACPVYDTQCGAKLFRVTTTFKSILDTPFSSRWIFDVELLARFLQIHPGGRLGALRAIYEEPLREWRDVDGSKLKMSDTLKALLELAAIYHDYGQHTQKILSSDSESSFRASEAGWTDASHTEDEPSRLLPRSE